MRILVLGGSVFLSKATAADAAARGHEVTCVTRGRSGEVPDGARHVVWDRADDVPAELATEAFDAVVDVSRIPSHVRKAVAAWPDAHWVFVSTVNVYSDNATPDPGVDGPFTDAIEEDRDLSEDPEAYGGMKVACERLVLDGVARPTVVRPGLIVGPGDPTGRYGYWPERLADSVTGGRCSDPATRPTGCRSSTCATWPSGSSGWSRPGRRGPTTASGRRRRWPRCWPRRRPVSAPRRSSCGRARSS